MTRSADRHVPVPAVLVIVLVVAGCVPPDFPDDPLFAGGQDLESPEILPTAPIRAARDVEPRAEPAKAELDARGAALRQRADALRAAEP